MFIIQLKTIVLTAVLLFFVSAGIRAGEVSSELQQVLDTASPQEEIAVIVYFHGKVDRQKFARLDRNIQRQQVVAAMKKKARENQLPVQSFLKNRGVQNTRSLWTINGLAMVVTPATIEMLAARQDVREIRLDRAVVLASGTSAATADAQWNLAMIGADFLWAEGFHGQDVVVASMDTGVDLNHNQLQANWRGGGWYDPHGEHPDEPYDADGHGTQTMGIMAGQNLGGSTIGVAPLAQWIAVKAFNDSGHALESHMHAGYAWLLDPDGVPETPDQPDVVNNSWGYPETRDTCDLEFAEVFQLFRDLGISVVFSSGNRGGAYTSISPANNPGVFSVGAVDEWKNITYYSGQGPTACSESGAVYPTAVAPGHIVTTADKTSGVYPDATKVVFGTSFSAPHVTGALALLRSAFPYFTATELETALTASAEDLGEGGPDNVYGHGLVNAGSAYSYILSGGQCNDSDNDGYFVEPFCSTAVDCNDGDSSIYPGAPETPDDGIDQDCDGADLQQCGGADLDGDGYYTDPSCGMPLDCNDTDSSVYPGSPETPADGVDQDCNGYDLTITIVTASYVESDQELTVEATSSLGANAGLELVGYGTMKYNRKKAIWAITSGSVVSDPLTVTVAGKEGEISSPTTVDSGGDSGGSSGGGKGKKR